MRPISPGGAVRFGVFGSLSKKISVMANTLRIITAGSEPTRDSGRASLSQPRCTAHATAAGGVSDRNPAKSPIRNANNSVICLDYIDPKSNDRKEDARVSQI